MDLSMYRKAIAALSDADLEDEVQKLSNLLSNINQDNKDRIDTINIINKEIEEAKKELALRAIDKLEASGNEKLF